MKRLIFILLQAALITLPVICFSQTFEGLYDMDSTQNDAYHLFIKLDGSYFMIGFTQFVQSQLQMANLTVSADGSQELSNHVLELGNTTAFTYDGNNGTAKQLREGYLSPITLQMYPLTGGILRSLAGLVKFDGQGDTVFVKFYTDTTVSFEYAFACTVMQDGGYLLGANRSLNPDSSGFLGPDSILLIRTDSNGNELWSKIYQKYTTQWATPNSLDTLSNGRILMGAMSAYSAYVSGHEYDHNTPWFIILDSMGNILKDTVYSTLYAGGVLSLMI